MASWRTAGWGSLESPSGPYPEDRWFKSSPRYHGSKLTEPALEIRQGGRTLLVYITTGSSRKIMEAAVSGEVVRLIGPDGTTIEMVIPVERAPEKYYRYPQKA